MKNLLILTCVLACFCGVRANAGAAAPSSICFNSPAENDRGSMILGNGEVGALAWVSKDGTLHTILQRSDSWDEVGRHLKVGGLDYVTGAPVDAGSFHQELSVAEGLFSARWTSHGRAVALSYRIQHGDDPFAVCSVTGAPATQAKTNNWRVYPNGVKTITPAAANISMHNAPGVAFDLAADVLVSDGWYHANDAKTLAKLMDCYNQWQATGDLNKPELLKGRIFGCLTQADRAGDRALFVSAVTCYAPCKDAADWTARTRDLLAQKGWKLAQEDARLAAHRADWSAFWDRSHLVITPSASAASTSFELPSNPKLPISFGVDSTGGSRLNGSLTDVDLSLNGACLFSGSPTIGQTLPAPGTKHPAPSTPTGTSLRFACTLMAKDIHANQRLCDHISVGKSDGWLVDLLGGRIRFLIGAKGFTHPKRIVANRAMQIVAEIADGQAKVTIDGACETYPLVMNPEDVCRRVTAAWANQRYVTACAGRGRLPIRFNGSIFTTCENGDPDSRRWGHGYWWQNTRLPYYPTFEAGDIEISDSLFRTYIDDTLAFNAARTRKYLNHDGAYFPECMQPWGDHFGYIYGQTPWAERTDKLQQAGWHKYEWVGQLELCLMLIRRYAFTQDRAWFQAKALPAIRAYVRYFEAHYPLVNGKMKMYPAQALETWWDCTDPMPEVAGLRGVTTRLLALPKGVLTDDDRAFFARVLAETPELPTRTLKNGQLAYAPAARFEHKGNIEHPELYSVFPFRLCSYEKANVELGRRTYAARTDRAYNGWKQEELFAAYLGLADEAAKHVTDRVLTNSAREFRWPAYWGPNYDWRPDQCAGGNIQNILQSMLLQHDDDRKIYLLPAWPKNWNCAFKLHAPYQTTIEGRIENGELKDLVVTPASRRADVVVAGK